MIILIKSFCLAEGNPHGTAAFPGNGVYGGQAGFLSAMLGGEATVLSFSCMSAETAGRETTMQEAIDRIVSLGCEAMRTNGEVVWNYGMPPLVNDDETAGRIEAAAQKIIGGACVIQGKNPSLGSEDFSYLFPEYAPGVQFSLGTGTDRDPNTRIGLHNGKNVFDEGGMAVGAAVMVQFTRDFLI